MAETRASRELVRLLAVGGVVAEKVKGAIHRVQLWNYTSGRRRADIDTAAAIETMTRGRIRSGDWAITPDGQPLKAPHDVAPEEPPPTERVAS